MATESAHAYAWNWFALHANQRLQLVNFWLIAVSFLAAAFVQSEVSHLRAISGGVSLIGLIASLAFLRLEVRTRRLVWVAEDALSIIERQWIDNGAPGEIALVARTEAVQSSWLDSYRTVIQGLQAIVALVFACAFLYALRGRLIW